MKSAALILLFTVFALSMHAQQAEFLWALSCGNPPNTTDTKTVLAHGEDGAFYLAGEFTDTAMYGQHMMISEGGTDIGLICYNSDGEVEWAMQIGAGDYDYVQNISVDENGDIIMAGYFYGHTVIGDDEYTAYGSQDIFVARFDAEGNFLWSRRFGGPMADYVAASDRDDDGNLYVTGYFYDGLTIGDTVLVALYSSDVYLAKYSPSGEFLWALSAGGSSSDQVRSLSCGPDGTVFMTCSFYYDFTIGGTTLTTADPVGGLVAEVSAEGQPGQVIQLQGSYLTPDVYVKATTEGNIYLAGNFSEEIHFGNTTFNAGEFNQDIFIVKYDSNGDLVWANNAASRSSDQVLGIDTDPWGNLYLTGHFLDTIAFGQMVIPYKLCCGSREIFVVGYNAGGKAEWGKQVTGPRASVQALSVDHQGLVRISGLFNDTLAFDAIDLNSYTEYRTFFTSLETDMATGADDPATFDSGSFGVYPNPAGDRIWVHGDFSGDPVRYGIFDLTGSVVISGRMSVRQTLDISELSPGLYFMRIWEEGQHQPTSARFIKL
jgi:hypothetical protein